MQYQHDIPRNIKSTVQARCFILISANNRQNQRHFYFLQLPATNVKRNEQAYEIEHSDSRFDSLTESIRFGFPKKKRNVRFDCTGCWRLSAKPPIDGLPQLTRQSRSRHTSACRSSLIIVVTRQSRRRVADSQLHFDITFSGLFIVFVSLA